MCVGSDDPIRLGRDSESDCVPLTCLSCDPYQNQRLAAPTNTTFVARIGPSGDQRGYMGITSEENPIIRCIMPHSYTLLLLLTLMKIHGSNV